MKKLIFLSLCFFWMALPVAHAELPKEVRADLLKDEIITAVRNGQYRSAQRHIDGYRKLGVDMPAALLLLEAKVSAKTGDWVRAKNVLESYFTKFGKADAGYSGALDLYKSVTAPAVKQQKIITAKQAKAKAAAAEQAKHNQLRRDCDKGSGASCTNLGYQLQLRPNASPAELADAARLYTKGCKARNAAACNNLGSFNESGRGGIKKDFVEARALYQRACDGGQKAVGCFNLATLHRNGVGTPQNDYEARRLYKISCDAGRKEGCTAHETIPKPARELREELEKTCTSERNGQLCWQAAEMYRRGKGGPVDLTRAYELHKRGCGNLNYKDSCYQNGLSKFTGSGTKKNLQSALDLFNTACRNGHQSACTKKREEEAKIYAVTQPLRTACFAGDAAICTELGQIYDDGLRGVPLDDYHASILFEKACEGGDAQGCNILGYFYDTGEGVTTDKARSMELYQKACKGGYGKACNNIAIIYLSGDNVRKSKFKSKRYRRKSCKLNYQPACDNLEKH